MFFINLQECLYSGHRGAVVEFPALGPRTSRRFPQSSAKASDWKSSTSARTLGRKFYYRPSVAEVMYHCFCYGKGEFPYYL